MNWVGFVWCRGVWGSYRDEGSTVEDSAEVRHDERRAGFRMKYEVASFVVAADKKHEKRLPVNKLTIRHKVRTGTIILRMDLERYRCIRSLL